MAECTFEVHVNRDAIVASYYSVDEEHEFPLLVQNPMSSGCIALSLPLSAMICLGLVSTLSL